MSMPKISIKICKVKPVFIVYVAQADPASKLKDCRERVKDIVISVFSH